MPPKQKGSGNKKADQKKVRGMWLRRLRMGCAHLARCTPHARPSYACMPAPLNSGPAVSHTNTPHKTNPKTNPGRASSMIHTYSHTYTCVVHVKPNPKTQAERIIEDKTFGLKNKSKSKKVQQYVQTVTAQTKHNVRTYENGTRVRHAGRSIDGPPFDCWRSRPSLVRCCPHIIFKKKTKKKKRNRRPNPPTLLQQSKQPRSG